MSNYRANTGKIQDEPGASCIPERREVPINKKMGHVKEILEPTERAINSQGWTNMGNEITNVELNYTP